MRDDIRSAVVRFVLEEQRDAVVVLSPEGRVVEANARARSGDGLDLVGLFDEAGPRAAAFVDEIRARRRAHVVLTGEHGAAHRLNGAEVDGWLIVVAHDVGDARHPREEEERVRFCAALAATVASFVHDFGNLLAPVLLTSARLHRALEPGSDEAAMASAIHSGTLMASALVRDVVDLMKPRPPVLERLDVNTVVADLRHFLECLLGDHAELELALAEPLGETEVDRRRLERALVNLVTNARDAMPNGGRVTIATRVVERELRSYVELSVADTGIGMPEDVRRRAFEPFFTTKPRGVGVGLSCVRQLVDESGGTVSIVSAPQRGTTVTLRLGRVSPEEARAPDA